MKKIISILIVVMMFLSLFAVSAVAYDVDAESGNTILEGADKEHFGGSSSTDVQIKIDGDLNHRYAVDIVFDTVVFVPNSGAIWDTNKHEYYHSDDFVWNGTGTVTVTNHSDAAITYKADATVTATEYGVAIVFDGATEYAPIPVTQINGCAVNGTPPSDGFTYGVVGIPTVAQLGVTTLGTIKVTVAPV